MAAKKTTHKKAAKKAAAAPPPPGGSAFTAAGKMSTFGGPLDFGMSPSEGLALFDKADLGNPAHAYLFLPTQPPGTTGLGRRLNPDKFYLACRWDYAQTSRSFLRRAVAVVTNPQNGKSAQARPVDWGPNVSTGRVADLSPGLAAALGLETDDDCEVVIPHLAPMAVGVPLAPAAPTAVAADHGHGTGNPFSKPQVITSRRSPYHSSRNGGDIDRIVLHYTTAATAESTLSHFESNPKSLSSHYLVDKNGDIYQMVDDDRRANHCKGANRNTLGIEHVATAGQQLTAAQRTATVALIRWLCAEYHIPLENIQGHRYTPGYSGGGTDCPHSLFGPQSAQAVRDWVQANIPA